jgi:molecular chaperone HscB
MIVELRKSLAVADYVACAVIRRTPRAASLSTKASDASADAARSSSGGDKLHACQAGGTCSASCAAPTTAPYVQCCWSCGTCVNKAALLCGTCAYVQAPENTANYFELLELPQAYELDATKLEANFKRLQKMVHPDLYSRKSKKEQEASASASSALNVAYRVLRDDAARAQYLLKLQGFDAIGERAGRDTKVSPELLMQVMEARELISEASADEGEVKELQRRTREAVTGCLSDLAAAFRSKDLATARSITVALQYYTKLEHEIGEWFEARPKQDEQSKQMR